MSSINVVYSPTTEEFVFTVEGELVEKVNIVAGIDLDRDIMPLINFSTGYSLVSSDTNLEESWPKEGEVFFETDQTLLIATYVPIKPDRDYTLTVWFRNFGMYFSGSYTFKTEKPIQNYPSWIWNGDEWVAPIPKPEEYGVPFIWNEDLQIWERVE